LPLNFISYLQAFYDEDVLDEEVLIDWDSKISKKYVSKEISTEIHAKAAPFIKWLKEAEEESSEEEEDSEDDVEVGLLAIHCYCTRVKYISGNVHFLKVHCAGV